MTSPQKAAEFRDSLLKAVDEGLLVCGRIVRDALYHCLATKYKIKREQIHERLEDFHKAMTDLLGDGPATVLGRLIAKRLYDMLRLDWSEHRNWTLAEYAKHAQRQFDSRT